MAVDTGSEVVLLLMLGASLGLVDSFARLHTYIYTDTHTSTHRRTHLIDGVGHGIDMLNV